MTSYRDCSVPHRESTARYSQGNGKLHVDPALKPSGSIAVTMKPRLLPRSTARTR